MYQGKAIMSRNITVACKDIESFFEIPKDGSHIPRGVEGKMLITLMESLGLNYKLVSPMDSEGGRRNKDGSWTGIIGLVLRGEADIGLPSLVNTYDRSKVVDFTVPYLFTNLHFVTELPKELPRFYAYVYPFDLTTWFLLLSMVLFLPGVIVKLFKIRDLSKEWLNMFGNVLGRAVPRKVSGHPQVLFTVFWWFGALIISFAYTSLFFSYLSVPPVNIPPKDFYQLAEAVQKGEYRVFAPRRMLYRTLIESSPNEALKSITAAMKKNDWYYDDERSYFTGKIGYKNAHIGSAVHDNLRYGKGPLITKYQSEGLISVYCSLPVNKGLPDLKAKLDRQLLRFQQAGLFEKYIQDSFYRKRFLNSVKESPQLIKPLSFNELFSAFLILAGGWFLSGTVLILEWWFKRRSRTVG